MRPGISLQCFKSGICFGYIKLVNTDITFKEMNSHLSDITHYKKQDNFNIFKEKK